MCVRSLRLYQTAIAYWSPVYALFVVSARPFHPSIPIFACLPWDQTMPIDLIDKPLWYLDKHAHLIIYFFSQLERTFSLLAF